MEETEGTELQLVPGESQWIMPRVVGHVKVSRMGTRWEESLRLEAAGELGDAPPGVCFPLVSRPTPIIVRV